MPSAPAARPFFNRRIALVTSCNIGTSSETLKISRRNIRGRPSVPVRV